jgi:thymidylate synthase (FAD)
MTRRIVGNGFVELVDHMGDAVTVVNAARISHGRQVQSLGEADERLLRYLWDHEHTSPFRHVQLQFHIKAPIFVLRQWMKHQVGCAWNEISGRYVTFEEEAWATPRWREAAPKVKQGSGGDLGEDASLAAAMLYESAMGSSFAIYEQLLALGVAKEQARLVLPLSLMSECFWTCSLHALVHFLELRTAPHAQAEIREYAEAVKDLALGVPGLDAALAVCLG